MIKYVSALALCAPLILTAAPAVAELDRLEIIAPAGAGGGYDQNARIFQSILQDKGLANRIQVENRPGAGGTIGLADFHSSHDGEPALLMVGLALVGAVLTNDSAVALDDLYPLALLSGEYQPIVVAADSPLQNLEDLIEMFKENPSSVSWAGSGPGSTDHMLYGLLARAAGMDPTDVNYIVLSSGGEMISGILGGHVTVGTSGYSELAAQIDSGEMRVLGVASPERIEGIDAPTFKEQGYDVSFINWRAVMAPAGLDEAERAELAAAVQSVVESPEWAEALNERGWQNIYLPPSEFAAFLQEEQDRAESLLSDLGLL